MAASTPGFSRPLRSCDTPQGAALRVSWGKLRKELGFLFVLNIKPKRSIYDLGFGGGPREAVYQGAVPSTHPLSFCAKRVT